MVPSDDCREGIIKEHEASVDMACCLCRVRGRSDKIALSRRKRRERCAWSRAFQVPGTIRKKTLVPEKRQTVSWLDHSWKVGRSKRRGVGDVGRGWGDHCKPRLQKTLVQREGAMCT